MSPDPSHFLRLDFSGEAAAKEYLRDLLRPYFVVYREVECQHLLAGNTLRIDYVMRPRDGIDFPFDWFGVEAKRSISGGDYNRALKQTIDYTFCAITDQRPGLARIRGQRIERAYLWPGQPDHNEEIQNPYSVGQYYWLNRFVGTYHVGLIYARQRRPWQPQPLTIDPWFLMCSDRQWSPIEGAIARKHNVHQRVGSGVLRVVK